MIDHTALNVSDLDAAKSFYSKALEPLGYSLAFEQGNFLGFADAAGLSLGVVCREPIGGGHVAFAGSPAAALNYFGVNSFEEIYEKLVREASPAEWGAERSIR